MRCRYEYSTLLCNCMKTILISISKDAMRRNIIDAPFWEAFQNEAKDVHSVIVVEEEKVSWYEENYGSDKVSICGYKGDTKNIFWKIGDFLARAGIDTHSARYYRMTALAHGNTSWATTLLKGIIGKTLVYIPGFKFFVRRLLLSSVHSKQIKAIFDEKKPDVVFTPSMTDIEYDIPIAAEAKRRGVFLLGMVRSWDNLTSHNLLGVIPDKFVLQNKFLKDVAESFIQGINTDIKVSGLPHYDMYKHPEPHIVEKEEFFSQMGLDKEKKLILLGGSDLYSVPEMKHLMVTLNEAIESGELKDMQVLFRPHPKFPCKRDEFGMDALQHITIDDGQGEFTFSEKFISSIVHSELVAHISSTLAIDAAVLGKPNICINYDDPSAQVPYWESVGRAYDTFTHYEHLLETGGAALSHSPEEFVSHIQMYLENPKMHEEGRVKIIEEFVEPFDGKASERLKNIVISSI